MEFISVKLENILVLDSIKKGIASDLFDDKKDLTDLGIKRTLEVEKDNVVSVQIDVNGELCDFENTLHKDYERELFLLESRLFKVHSQEMVNGYLMVLDKELNLINRTGDCVWEYADWKEA